jgi:hypothetical protein
VARLINYRNAADVKALHDLQRFTHRTIRSNRHWIDDHSRFGSFYFIDFFCLPFDAQVLMNDSDATLLRKRDRERCLRDRVHRG